MALTKNTRKNKKASASSDIKKLKLLITVVSRKKTEFFIDLLGDLEANFQLSVLGQGTAHSETLRLLGLEDADKSVLFSVIREDKATEALRVLGDKFEKVRGGKGIAFTIPLSSVIGVAIYRFLSNNKTTV